jgi:hypothetical protein
LIRYETLIARRCVCGIRESLQEEFERAEHLLCAIEVIAWQQNDCGQVDAAYALLAQLAVQSQSDTREGTQ